MPRNEKTGFRVNNGTHPGQAKASARKRQRQAENRAALQAEAATRGISADALLEAKRAEADQFRTRKNPTVTISATPAPYEITRAGSRTSSRSAWDV